MRFRVTTWNVNSVRLRLGHLATLIAAHDPDILCLQETKVVDELFPRDAFAEAGFTHQHIHGQKSYNGVAILSRLAFEPLKSRDWCAKGDCRHAAARFAEGIELHNFYVPAGGDVPDPEANPKFAHKLDFLAEMACAFGARKAKRSSRLILAGDLNIAPLETDVWSHKQLLKVVSHTPVEVEALGALQAAHRLGRRGAPHHPARRETLFLVVVPGAGLGGGGPRAAPRSCLGDPGIGRRCDRRPGAARGARLEAALGPRTGERDAGDLSGLGALKRRAGSRRISGGPRSRA